MEIPSRKRIFILGTGYGGVKKIRANSASSQFREMVCFLIDWPVNCPIIGHVLLLAADTSSPSGSLSVLHDEFVLGLIHTVSDEPYSSRLFRHLDFLLHDLSLELKDFDIFAVASGPGSFTGLRVGLSAAKAWAEAFRKPIVGISALHAVAAQSRLDAPFLVPIIDAQRQQLYYALFQNSPLGQFLQGEEKVASPEEFVEDIRRRTEGSSTTLVTTSGELLAQGFDGFSAEAAGSEVVSPALAPWVGRLALDQARSGKLSDSLSLDANYVRRSDAELHWNGP